MTQDNRHFLEAAAVILLNDFSPYLSDGVKKIEVSGNGWSLETVPAKRQPVSVEDHREKIVTEVMRTIAGYAARYVTGTEDEDKDRDEALRTGRKVAFHSAMFTPIPQTVKDKGAQAYLGKISENAYERAVSILASQKPQLLELAGLLEKNGALDGAQIKAVLEPPTSDTPPRFSAPRP